MEKKYFSGFTLVELLIVVMIIMVLAALIIAFFPSQIFKGNDARRKSDIQRIQIAAEEYEKDHNCYPDSIVCGVHSNQEVYPYLNNVPCDPITNASYVYLAEGIACPQWYRIFTVLQNTKDPAVTLNVGPFGAFNYVQSSENGEITAAPVSNTPAPTGSGPSIPDSGFYGCFSGTCNQINWNPAINAPECARITRLVLAMATVLIRGMSVLIRINTYEEFYKI